MQMACWWTGRPLPAALCLGLSQGGGRVGVSEEEDRAGWQRESLLAVGEWKKLGKQPSVLFLFLPRCGPAAWVSKVTLGRGLRSIWLLIRASAAKDPSSIPLEAA